MKTKLLLICAVVGAVLGALIAWLSATEVFVCRGSAGTGSVACPAPDVVLAITWGTPIGLAVGIVAAFLLSRRRAATSRPSG